jgi:L-lactate transport
MWPHHYTPLAGNLGLSALVAALPIFTLLYLLGIRRKPSWIAALSGLGVAMATALFLYRMPPGLMLSSVAYGAAFGLFPISWIVFSAILLYRITVHTGKFEILKDSIGSLTRDRRLQALLIAFSFGAFVEGAAGFGTPVAVAAAMLAGLGFSPFYAAGICLLANTAPVAFGSIGIPVITLAGITGLPMQELSAGVGRICAPISLIVPAYLVAVMGGWRGLRGVWPAALLCGFSFALTQFLVSNYIGPHLTDILSALAAILSLVILFRFWQPKDHFVLEGSSEQVQAKHHTASEIALAWAPYGFLVLFVLLWGFKPVNAMLNSVSIPFGWPGLHNLIERVPPVTPAPSPYAAMYTFNWLSASGTACLFAAISSALLLRLSLRDFWMVVKDTAQRMALPTLTIASVLGLAFLMNYSGATNTMGLAFAATGVLFPFFSALLGWLGVFLTGSDTSANALFGNMQVVTAQHLGLNEILMASSNSAGGVMGKMISLQSIAVAVAATGMATSEEGKLFRFTARHSVILASAIGLVVVFYAYVVPQWAP